MRAVLIKIKPFYSFLLIILVCLELLPVVSIAQQQQVNSQEKEVITGIVLESGTSKRLAKVNITNKTQNLKTTTDLKGEFSIQVSIGDALVFSNVGYESQVAIIQTFSDILIDLKATSILLETVTIEQKSKAAELQDVLDSYTRHGIYQGGKPSIMSYVFMPITSLYERFSTKGKQARNFRNFMENELEGTHIDRLFSRYKVTSLTDLSGDDLTNFMLIYRPTYEQSRFWKDYDVTKHIKDSYQKFLQDGKPEAIRLPRITPDTKF